MRAFAAAAAPSEAEQQRREEALQVINAACAAAFGANPRMAVRLFGSGAHGIGFRRAELDIAVAGMMTPLVAGGVSPEQRDLAACKWGAALRF